MQEGHFLTANIITANIFIRKYFKLNGSHLLKIFAFDNSTNYFEIENIKQY
jgi:hypothetical protein